MPIRKPKPTSPGRRFISYADYAEVTKTKPEKSLTEGLKKSGGRNAHGRKTSRHRGGGAKRLYRLIDFKRTKDGIPAKVASIEYDPNRSAYIALLYYLDGEKRYILAPARLRVGMSVQSGPGSDIVVGNALPLANMPVGTIVHNVEMQPGRGGEMGRSAGVGIQLMAKEGDYATLRLPSGEMRLVRTECRATVGTIGNADHQNVTIGKAGRKRHMGVRPQTRGTAMNPVDHPHGGGEGATPLGNHPRRRGACRRSATAPARSARDPTVTSSEAAAAARRVDADVPLVQEGPVRRGAPDAAHRDDEQGQTPSR